MRCVNLTWFPAWIILTGKLARQKWVWPHPHRFSCYQIWSSLQLHFLCSCLYIHKENKTLPRDPGSFFGICMDTLQHLSLTFQIRWSESKSLSIDQRWWRPSSVPLEQHSPFSWDWATYRMFNCCSHETLLHFGLQSSCLNICNYNQDLYEWLLHAGLCPSFQGSLWWPSYLMHHRSCNLHHLQQPGMGLMLHFHD